MKAFWKKDTKLIETEKEVKRLEDRIIELGNTNNDLKNRNRELKDRCEKVENIFKDLQTLFNRHIEIKKHI